YARPVSLVGHSLGGYLSPMAALKRPQWVRGVVWLDSPLIAGWRSSAPRVSQWTGLDEGFAPAAAARTRRGHSTGRGDAWRPVRAESAVGPCEPQDFDLHPLLLPAYRPSQLNHLHSHPWPRPAQPPEPRTPPRPLPAHVTAPHEHPRELLAPSLDPRLHSTRTSPP
ncbi:hypothetical protein NX875_29435, partial [Burkholderia thailandensis]|uniref:alpha/beta fold hydrolase n=1 Tax=Burkholderia thailandensis TaxID=57975 RepID=UPI0035C6812C|nr:hypothetical protein [Burkholderia thailandensis]